jgi:hypothetical protein
LRPVFPLRVADEFLQAGAAEPNGFVRHEFADQNNLLRIDAASGKCGRAITQSAMTDVMILCALDQPDFVVDSEYPGQRMHQLGAKRDNTCATQAKAERHVQRKGAPISETGQHEAARIQAECAQLLMNQRFEIPRRAIKYYGLGAAI